MCSKVFPVNAQNFPVTKRKKRLLHETKVVYYYRRTCVECFRNKIRKYVKEKRERRERIFEENKSLIRKLYAKSKENCSNDVNGSNSFISIP